ncbi:hypothetical protein Tco_1213175 [Tanacetum coccineum]
MGSTSGEVVGIDIDSGIGVGLGTGTGVGLGTGSGVGVGVGIGVGSGAGIYVGTGCTSGVEIDVPSNILDLYFKHFNLSKDFVNRILQVVLDLQHFKSSLFIFSATILQGSSAIHHISNIDNMYIKSYSFNLFSSLPAHETMGVEFTIGFWQTIKAINGFDMPLPVAVCSGLVNPLAPRKDFEKSLPRAVSSWTSQSLCRLDMVN